MTKKLSNNLKVGILGKNKFSKKSMNSLELMESTHPVTNKAKFDGFARTP